MSDLLTGRCLNWICFDQRGLLTAYLRDRLQEWVRTVCPPQTLHEPAGEKVAQPTPVRQRLVLHATEWTGNHWRPALRSQLASPGISLIAWSVADTTEFEAACGALRFARDAAHPMLRLCLLAPALEPLTPILLEAGAQTVVSQLPSLHKELAQLLTRVSLSGQGFHPLTSGLLERLPWQPS